MRRRGGDSWCGLGRDSEGWKRTVVTSRGLDWWEGGWRDRSMIGRGVLVRRESIWIWWGDMKVVTGRRDGDGNGGVYDFEALCRRRGPRPRAIVVLCRSSRVVSKQPSCSHLATRADPRSQVEVGQEHREDHQGESRSRPFGRLRNSLRNGLADHVVVDEGRRFHQAYPGGEGHA